MLPNLLIICFITLLLLILIEIILPICRFMIRAKIVIKLYNDYFKILFRLDPLYIAEIRQIEIPYGIFKISFSSVEEASLKFETLAIEALEYYNQLGSVHIADNFFTNLKYKLLDILNEVKMFRWKNQYTLP